MKRVVVASLCLIAGCGPNGGTFHPKHDGGLPDASVSCVNGPKDSDGDGIADKDEGAPSLDTDHDGTPDYLDDDSDNDGIPDSVEGRNGGPCFPPVDSDGDGKPDFQDLDSDSPTDSTVADAEEAGANPAMPVDTNHDGKPDYMDPDNDGDGISDVKELTPQGGAVAATMLALAPDTDGDGVPDFLDDDSDGDTILDSMEGAVDTDGDGIPNYRDLDSDGDCIPDAIEAGRTDKHLPPVDTDGDGAPDFEDIDSDNEGLIDKLEDKNCNGVVDACETDRLKVDTDGDGVNDLIESEDCSVKTPAQQAALNCACWGADATQSPLTAGDFVFIVDYMKPPTPSSETLNLSTNVSNADVIFALDSTGSMQGSLTTLASTLASSIVPQTKAQVQNIAFGVLEFRDTGDTWTAANGLPAAAFLRYDHRIQTVNTAAGVSAIQATLGKLVATGGGDSPEGGWEALYSIAGGPAITVNAAGYVSTLPLASTPPQPPTAGETQGTLYGAGFRSGTVPIIVTCTDAEWHDAPGVATSGENGLNDYSTTYGGMPSRATALQYVNMMGAHVIALAGIGGGQTGDPKARGLATATATGAVVAPADFGPVGTRPAGCAITQCCTGQNGIGEAPNGSGQCPLSFSFDDATGNGVNAAVVSGIVALANGLKFDIHVQAVDVDPMTVDNFMLELAPNLSGMGPAAVCITVPPQPLQDNFTGPKATPGSDTVLDTFPGISGGKQICFDVVPKMNAVVMPTSSPQFFRAQLQVKGIANGMTINLGTPRDVFFLVPPNIVNGPIN